MNRLILIGNGFDLAHGLKTSYNDFIRWYLKQSFGSALKTNYEDELIKISQSPSFHMVNINEGTIALLVEESYKINFESLYSLGSNLYGLPHSKHQPFIVFIKSQLLQNLLNNCSDTRWVDIEGEFYEQLKSVLNKQRSTDGRTRVEAKAIELKSLNQSLKFIIAKLETYLANLEQADYDERYMNIFTSKILESDVHATSLEISLDSLTVNSEPENTYMLNFNYTSTLEKYLQWFHSNSGKPLPIINYIHGRVESNDNPLVFGFGDELDDAYLKMEQEKAKGYFEHIKSFWYFKTSNYRELTRFIDSNNYQVYVLGHSCGLSDRTMLHMIFEHPSCKSIKIYYHGDKEKNNYTDITYDIARHFKNKAEMRNKIVSLDGSEPMPQI